MEFALHVPNAPLCRLVESITFFAGATPPHQREKLIPDGAITIVVDLTETPKKLFASATSPVGVSFSHTFISGMQRRWIVIEAQQQASMLAIRFWPGGAHAIVRQDAADLTDGVYPLDDVIGRTSLRDRVIAAPTVAAKFAAAEGWLLERARDGVALHPAAVFLAARLGRGQRVGDLAEATGFTARHTLNLFRQFVGVTPKQYARISRFQLLLEALGNSPATGPALDQPALPPPDWAQLAAATGYADQSHLSHEFVAFAGMTPGAYAAVYRGLSNYLPIKLPSS